MILEIIAAIIGYEIASAISGKQDSAGDDVSANGNYVTFNDKYPNGETDFVVMNADSPEEAEEIFKKYAKSGRRTTENLGVRDDDPKFGKDISVRVINLELYQNGELKDYARVEREGIFYAEGGTLELDRKQAKKAFHLPIEMAIYVPSTSNVDKSISPAQMKARVKEVSVYLSQIFGGYTSQETLGGYVDSQGNLVNEQVVRVVSFGTLEKFEQNKQKILQKIADWCKKWSQEAIGFEVEGDLYYIPENFAKGGKTGMKSSIDGRLKELEEGLAAASKKHKMQSEMVGQIADDFNESFAEGGKLGFEGLAKKVAKRYEGEPVPQKFREEYGETYSKKEAMEVGRKVAAKVYRQQLAKKGK